ncbi:hypothetical protein DMI70_13455 [Escherichia coli]|nr:hypothetical protein [Escherichia coli]
MPIAKNIQLQESQGRDSTEFLDKICIAISFAGELKEMQILLIRRRIDPGQHFAQNSHTI